MSDTWKILSRLTEASEKDRLLSYIKNKWGDQDAESIRPFIDKMWNAEHLPGLARAVSDHYKDADGNYDPELEKIFNRADQELSGPGKSSKTTVQRRKDRDAPATPAQGNSRQDLIRGLASGERMSPADIERQRQATAATAASRPDRAGVQGSTPASKGAAIKPGERPEHDIGLTPSQAPGSAPGHTRPVQRQVSQQGGGEETAAQRIARYEKMLEKDPEHPQADKIKSAIANLKKRDPDEVVPGVEATPGAGQELPGLRSELDQLRQRMSRLPTMIQQTAQRAVALKQSDPARSQEFARQANQMRGELTSLPKKIRDLEGKEKRIAQTGKSGLSDLQKQVDYMTQTYGAKRGDAVAKKLGVPTSGERTVKYKDKETGEDKERINIWSAEKIQRWKQKGPELAPGQYDKAPVQGVNKDAQGPWQGSGEKLPGPERGGQRAADAPHKPMMKAPKGAAPEELQKLADLRRHYSQLKKSGASEEELSLTKDEINQIMSAGGEPVDVVMPGKFDGQRWKPAGVAKKVHTSRPDKALGKTVHGSKFTDPSKEGQELVWTVTDPKTGEGDWLLPSERAAKKGEMAASLPPEAGERKPHRSTPELPGNPVSTSAAHQKAQAAATEPGKRPSHHPRDVKRAVGDAFED